MISQKLLDIQPQIPIVFAKNNTSDELRIEALKILEETSRTFYIPISRLPPGLLEAVGSGYLCMRAIDEIEDHPELDPKIKVKLLHNISLTLQSAVVGLTSQEFLVEQPPYRYILPEVTVRLSDWARMAPESIAPRVWDATAAMAERMAYWVANSWEVHSEADLDRYTFGVAGAVGLMLSDMWSWYDGTRTDRILAIGFGRGLQSVNILRNRLEDLNRGADFFPDSWSEIEMQAYSRRNLAHAEAYTQALPVGPARNFCIIPLVLALGTLEALEQGRSKLNREEVVQLVQAAISQ